MRIAVFFLLSGVLIIGFLAGCNSNETLVTKSIKSPTPAATPHPVQNPADTARRITAEELHDIWQKGQVLVVDTRTEPPYKQEHIKGAILMPATEFATRANELPLDKMIVTYCT